jgi:hypothetical protein
MKKLSFSLAIIGIFILLIILNYSPPLLITSSQNISILRANQKISVAGEVTSQTSAKLILDNKLEIYCDCSSKSYLNKNVSILAIVEEYDNKKTLQVLKIAN